MAYRPNKDQQHTGIYHWSLSRYTRMMPADCFYQQLEKMPPSPTAFSGSPVPSGEPEKAASVSASGPKS
ncbi:unnamed protein product [Staurois parvus]|uniref:Uncharacterized protein n=1 Tax=Staurois parvus TaxID=386267 RepID=A0ABN9A908_9NEOB|nr:unnamed protein product [Staurois parvus]